VTGVIYARREAAIDAKLSMLLFVFLLMASTINKYRDHEDILFTENM
jgi:hypothetical protein